jgi:hypothetical protein
MSDALSRSLLASPNDRGYSANQLPSGWYAAWSQEKNRGAPGVTARRALRPNIAVSSRIVLDFDHGLGLSGASPHQYRPFTLVMFGQGS